MFLKPDQQFNLFEQVDRIQTIKQQLQNPFLRISVENAWLQCYAEWYEMVRMNKKMQDRFNQRKERK